MKYQTTWNLGLLYKNEKDPQIEKDVKKIELLCTQFEKKYKGKDFTSTSKKLFLALEEYQNLSDSSHFQPWLYFFLKKDIDSNDSFAHAQSSSIEQRINTASNKVTFFILEVAKLPPAVQKKYLSDKTLQSFSYYLKKIFAQAKYNLDEKEEQLLLLLSQTSEVMWEDAQKKLLGNQIVSLNGKNIPLAEAKDRLPDLPIQKRHELAKKINATAKSISFLAEAELNAIYNFRKITDERRGYKTPYSASVLEKENTEEEIEGFADLVTKYFSLSHRFYTLHAKLLKQKKLTLADRRVAIGTIKTKFDFDKTLSIAKKALGKAGPQYENLLDTFIERGQIDVFPKKGKQAGGYCMTIGTLPTFILLNQTDNVQSVETLAHEMGHAIHGNLSKKLPSFYQRYSTATAEVASMFFEQFVALELQPYLSEDEKFILLHRNVCEDIYAIFCQIACFNFELELHELIRKQGQASKEEMAKLMQKHMQAYCGNAVEVTEDDGYLFVLWHHIRYNFYTYTYAYGGLISRVLFENWKKDPTYMGKVEQFLSAGGSMSPKDIFKSIGVNTNAAFFEAGLKGIEADINKLEKLSKNWLKNKKK